MKNLSIRRFFAARKDQEGITMVEYALMAALVAAALVTIMGVFTNGISTAFSKILTAMGV